MLQNEGSSVKIGQKLTEYKQMPNLKKSTAPDGCPNSSKINVRISFSTFCLIYPVPAENF